MEDQTMVATLNRPKPSVLVILAVIVGWVGASAVGAIIVLLAMKYVLDPNAYPEASASVAVQNNAAQLAQPTPPPVPAVADVQSPLEQSLEPMRAALKSPGVAIQRINSLVAFNLGLGEYAQKVGAYPNSEMKFVPAQGALTLMQKQGFAAQIPQEVLTLMEYKSDGQSYKVVVAGSGDCAVVRVLRAAMVDPERSDGLDCLAYGFWSPQGAAFR